MESLAPRLGKPEQLPERTAGDRASAAPSVGLLTGCVQGAFFPGVNAATARVLQAEGCDVVVPQQQGCCGALSVHNGREEEAQGFARTLVDTFEATGVERIVVNAAGCGSTMKEYAELLADDPAYADRAQAFAEKVRDISEILDELGPVAPRHPLEMTIAYHDACHLAHAQGVRAQPRTLLEAIPGLELKEIAEPELCCGSAGIYNIINPEPARELGDRKAANIVATGAQVLVTANPGCLMQVTSAIERSGHPMGMAHTVEVLDASIRGLPAEHPRPPITRYRPTEFEAMFDQFQQNTRSSRRLAGPQCPVRRRSPWLSLFVLLGGLRIRAWIAGLIALAVALVVAVVAVRDARRPGTQRRASRARRSASSRSCGSSSTRSGSTTSPSASGHFDVLRRSFEKVSPDQRIQAIIIAFCFGALLEALAGFGTPVAITVVMLMALGFKPIKAATVALVANTAPVAFGALAIPIVTLATVSAGRQRRPGLSDPTLDTLGADGRPADPDPGPVRAAGPGAHRRRQARRAPDLAAGAGRAAWRSASPSSSTPTSSPCSSPTSSRRCWPPARVVAAAAGVAARRGADRRAGRARRSASARGRHATARRRPAVASTSTRRRPSRRRHGAQWPGGARGVATTGAT